MSERRAVLIEHSQFVGSNFGIFWHVIHEEDGVSLIGTFIGTSSSKAISTGVRVIEKCRHPNYQAPIFWTLVDE